MLRLLSNRIGQEELKPGDHIYSWRAGYIYAHHGIYIGDEKVIHFTRSAGESSIGFESVLFSSSPPTRTVSDCQCCAAAQKQRQKEPENDPGRGVIISCLNCFLDGGNLYIFLYSVTKEFFLAKVRGGTCTMAHSDSPDLVLHRAQFLLNHGFGAYSLFKNNCEDFAIYCKTGLLVTSNKPTRSGQINSVLSLASTSSKLSDNPSLSGITGLVMGIVQYSTSRFLDDIGVRNDVKKVPVESISEIAKWSDSPTYMKGPHSFI